MIAQYVHGTSESLSTLVNLLARFAMPLAVLIGLIALAIGLSVLLQRENPWIGRLDWRQTLMAVLGAATLAIVLVVCWGALREAEPIARESSKWREAAEATTNAVPDAPAVQQYGPAAASLVQRTYTRTMNMPPDFLQRIGDQGVAALAPYLSDPSDAGVLRLSDTFKRSGQNVVLTREVSRLDESPIPFTKSDVRVQFRRLARRAFDASFEGVYAFQNRTAEPIDARFSFPLPQAGTVRDLHVQVGEQVVSEPGTSGAYEWKAQMQPGELREAVIRYRVTGARSWHYDLGSQRRRVERFRLEIRPDGQARFLRGSLQPTATYAKALHWDLSNVVTAQQVAIALPSDSEATEAFHQALSALPPTLILFIGGALAIGFWSRRVPGIGRLAAGALIFAFGLGSAVVLAGYVGSVAALIVGPLAGGLLAGPTVGVRSIPSLLPVSLIPAAFLSAEHTGLIVLVLAMASMAGLKLAAGRGRVWT